MTAIRRNFRIVRGMKARIKDESVPYLYNGYYYIILKRTILFILERKRAFGKEEIMFDCN
jgi:hypothetical protein